MGDHDLAIRWCDDKHLVRKIQKLGGVGVSGRPLHLKCPGGRVSVVRPDGQLAARFVVARIEGPQAVELPEGKSRPAGYLLRARKGSLKLYPTLRDRISIRWHSTGELRYFDRETGKAVFVRGIERWNGNYIDDSPLLSTARRTLSTVPFQGGVPGMKKNAPESELVNDYVQWIGEPERFGHNVLKTEDVATDLFDIRHWRLYEAKSKLDREILRMAHGQLLDYRRFFKRKPSLGVLLMGEPDKPTIGYLNDCGIVVVWRSGRGFRDTRDGAWTAKRRVCRPRQ